MLSLIHIYYIVRGIPLTRSPELKTSRVPVEAHYHVHRGRFSLGGHIPMPLNAKVTCFCIERVKLGKTISL